MSLQQIYAMERLAATWLWTIVRGIWIVIEFMPTSVFSSCEDLARRISTTKRRDGDKSARDIPCRIRGIHKHEPVYPSSLC